MAITPVNAAVTVTTAGTRVQMSSDVDYKPASVYVEALGSNTGYIYVGLSNVSSTVYISRLAAGEGLTIEVPGAGGANYRAGSQGIQLSTLYIDSSVNGEKAQLTYLYAQGG
jgi:hypothetical protein